MRHGRGSDLAQLNERSPVRLKIVLVFRRDCRGAYVEAVSRGVMISRGVFVNFASPISYSQYYQLFC